MLFYNPGSGTRTPFNFHFISFSVTEKGQIKMSYRERDFLSSSNIMRGERHPTVSHGEILQEKLAPYILLLPFLVLGWDLHSEANCISLCNPSVSPPNRDAFAAGFLSCMIANERHSQNFRTTSSLEKYPDNQQGKKLYANLATFCIQNPGSVQKSESQHC